MGVIHVVWSLSWITHRDHVVNVITIACHVVHVLLLTLRGVYIPLPVLVQGCAVVTTRYYIYYIQCMLTNYVSTHRY